MQVLHLLLHGLLASVCIVVSAAARWPRRAPLVGRAGFVPLHCCCVILLLYCLMLLSPARLGRFSGRLSRFVCFVIVRVPVRQLRLPPSQSISARLYMRMYLPVSRLTPYVVPSIPHVVLWSTHAHCQQACSAPST